jgi:hypothetical protein
MTARERAIRSRLRELEDETGYLDVDLVIRTARDNPEDPMHPCFTWDVEKAAWERWREQARAMIRRVRYVEQITQRELDNVPHYVSVTTQPPTSGYKAIDRVAQHEAQSREVFNDEIRRAIAAVERARAVSDILGTRDQLEVVLQQLIAIQQQQAA